MSVAPSLELTNDAVLFFFSATDVGGVSRTNLKKQLPTNFKNFVLNNLQINF